MNIKLKELDYIMENNFGSCTVGIGFDNSKCETMIILGGTGSLGRKLISRYLFSYNIINFSRDECKHQALRLEWNNQVENYSCDIFNYPKLLRGFIQYNPHIIIMAAAMKHIDACEKDSEASINTNVLGIKNVLDVVEQNLLQLTNIKCVVMVSTDKACSPINTYGICKALAEKMTIERALRCEKVKWVVTRYGNVLNSRGSIIPFLHNQGKSKYHECLTLTDKRMTRFIMTLDESVNLIHYAINESPTGTITIPILPSMRIEELFNIFGQKYQKKIKIVGSKKGEKYSEDLINEVEAELAIHITKKYVWIFPTHKSYSKYSTFEKFNMKNYGSDKYSSYMGLVNEGELKDILVKNKLLE